MFIVMKPLKTRWFCVLGGLLTFGAASMALAEDKANPYQAIIERNPFGLKDPPKVEPPQTNAPPKDIKKEEFYLTGISTIGLYLSYGIPLLLKLWAIRRGVWTERANGPWSLGNWTVPVNVIALAWIAFITVLFVLPPNELTGFIFAGTFAAMIVFYLARVRGKFRGPVPQARSPEELLTIEAELER